MKRRQYERVPVTTLIQVRDEVTDELMGQLGNLSYGGVLLIADRELPLDAVYQIRIEVPGPGTAVDPLSLGVETLWRQRANNGRSCWVGMRIIDMSDADRGRLRDLMAMQRP